MYLSSFSLVITHCFISFCITFSLFCQLRHLGSSCIHIASFGVCSGVEELKRILLDQFTRSRQPQRRLQFTRPLYSIKAASVEAADLSTRPSYLILYSTHLLDQGRPTLPDLLIYQSVFGSSSFSTQPDI